MKHYIPEILIFLFISLVIVGAGYLIVLGAYQQERAYNTCIAADKQYIKGTCVN